MHIIKVTWRNRNDFHFVAYCRWCGERSTWGDGYADAYYQQEVFPGRHCPHCDKDEMGVVSGPAVQRCTQPWETVR